MEQYYCTFKYFDRKGRRLAVFCRYLNAIEAEVFTLTCSNLDQFDKTFARGVYEKYLTIGLTTEFTEEYKPLIELVEIQPERREIWTLLNYCRKNYYILVDYSVDVIVPLFYNETTGKGFGETNLKIKTL